MTAVEEFWGETVLAGPFATLEESEASLAQRAEMFPGLYELMPVDLPGKVVLDYGCGPGHDTVQFLQNRARVVIYADVSQLALDVTYDRAQLHGYVGVPLFVSDSEDIWLPHVDYIHCAGVLHHASHPAAILAEFRNAVYVYGGEVRLMVYDGDRSEHTQSDVPITHWWGADDIAQMAATAGFTVAEYLGGYDCSAPWRPNCMAACWRLA